MGFEYFIMIIILFNDIFLLLLGIYDFPKSDQPLRVKRSTTIQELYNIVEKLVGLPPQQFRLWKFTSFSDVFIYIFTL
jgi:aminopeptidase C